MPFKPSELFLGVVNFLGVMVPGAIFCFLLLRRLPVGTGSKWSNWMVFAAAAYVFGQLLLAVSEILNRSVDGVAGRLSAGLDAKLWEVEKEFRQWYRNAMQINPVDKKSEDRSDSAFFFHTALSYVRLNHAEAAGEVDHHMADYKLLRSLVAVFLFDVIISIGVAPRFYFLYMVEVGLAALSFLCFVRMYNWARFLAFDYALSISHLKPSAPAASTPLKKDSAHPA